MSEKIEITSQLARAVRDSRLLLTYAAHAGLELEETMLEILVNAQYRVDFDEWTNEDEARFWQAFSALNVLIKPVTLESLKAVSIVETRSFRFRFLRFLNKAYRTAGFYALLSTIFIAVLLVMQMYWLMGEKLSQHLNDVTRQAKQISQFDGFAEGKFTEEYNALRVEIETTRETMVLWSTPWNVAFSTLEDQEFSGTFDREAEYQRAIAMLQEKLKEAAGRLTAFKDFQFDEAGGELYIVYQAEVDRLTENLIQQQTLYEQEGNESLFTAIDLRTQYVLHVLQRYLLPLLYGVLGATAYILRSLIADIQAETYTGKSNVKYLVRLFSGALCGLLIGFFIIPKEMSGLATLPPMALSFLAGYNVEVLFLTTDRLIAAVIKKIKGRTSQSGAPKEAAHAEKSEQSEEFQPKE